jgi:cob(I)alamin adenosyltransferase
LKVCTCRGDAGETDLFGGERVAKDHLRVEAYGAVDELNASLGAAAASSASADVRALVAELQARLFDLGAHLATPDPARRAKSELPGPRQEDVDALERRIDASEDAPLHASCCRGTAARRTSTSRAPVPPRGSAPPSPGRVGGFRPR